MLDFDFTNQFKKDYKLMKKRGKDLNKIDEIMGMLIWEEPLPARCREHNLHGDWDGYTECHIEGDWVLIYEREEGVQIKFAYTGTHSDYL